MKTVSQSRGLAIEALPRPTEWLAYVRRMRGRHLVVVDTIGLVLAAGLALLLTEQGVVDEREVGAYLTVILVPAVIRLAVNIRFGLYSRLWVHASVPDLTQVLLSGLAGSLVTIPVLAIMLRLEGGTGSSILTPSFWFVEGLLAISVMGGDRFLIRAARDIGLTRGVGNMGGRVPALLFGAGREGAMIARTALQSRNARVLPVGFLDTDGSRRGNTIAGLTVYGTLDALDDAIRRTGARMLLITMSNAPGSSVRSVMAAAQSAGLTVRRVPAVNELLDGTLDATRIRRIRVEDLLTREQVTVHASGVEAVISNQVVMVTGAGGSIGSELARQIFALGPRKLILVDRAESPLYMIERELDLKTLAGKGRTELAVHLANVVSRPAMSRLIEASHPSVIFHAAACKHVPMMEEHPSESLQVNVAGTMAVLDAAVNAGVERFVLVSTDKAVEPTSVMGATKRLAEWLVAEAAAETARPYVAVRFGNVLGSAGSVLPVFERQLERGEPLTVTHPDMTRYFMTLQEAGWLILDASAIGRPGDLFVLDMGDPVRIVDMAGDLIRLAGEDPLDVPIVFTGLRPGEKLHEKLYYDAETVGDTDVPKIRRVLDPRPPRDVRRVVRSLLTMAAGDQEAELRSALFAAVAERDDPVPRPGGRRSRRAAGAISIPPRQRAPRSSQWEAPATAASTDTEEAPSPRPYSTTRSGGSSSGEGG